MKKEQKVLKREEIFLSKTRQRRGISKSNHQYSSGRRMWLKRCVKPDLESPNKQKTTKY